MKKIKFVTAVLVLIAAAPRFGAPGQAAEPAQEGVAARNATSWTKKLKSREQRGTLQDAIQVVRGDSGKWSDEPQMQLAPAITRKPEKLSLDDWFDQLADEEFRPDGAGETWLLLRTRQLDDNDRLWIERIERHGGRFTIAANMATWQGKYSKNFTYYHVFGVNLGKLEPGDYEAKWGAEVLHFRAFDGDGRPRGNWSKDEVSYDDKPLETVLRFTVSPK
ncbi:MAG: hypothetical protein RIC55_31690 [Pirellulaceae bacterium]